MSITIVNRNCLHVCCQFSRILALKPKGKLKNFRDCQKIIWQPKVEEDEIICLHNIMLVSDNKLLHLRQRSKMLLISSLSHCLYMIMRKQCIFTTYPPKSDTESDLLDKSSLSRFAHRFVSISLMAQTSF